MPKTRGAIAHKVHAPQPCNWAGCICVLNVPEYWLELAAEDTWTLTRFKKFLTARCFFFFWETVLTNK